MQIESYGVDGEIACPQVFFQVGAAIGCEIEIGARVILVGHDDTPGVTLIVQDHEVCAEFVGDLSGEGNAIRWQGKIQVRGEA